MNHLKPTVISSADEVFTGQNAYVFLLEVVCGLKSPILGETEVHGQYREFLERIKASADKELYQVLHQVHVQFVVGKNREYFAQVIFNNEREIFTTDGQ